MRHALMANAVIAIGNISVGWAMGQAPPAWAIDFTVANLRSQSRTAGHPAR